MTWHNDNTSRAAKYYKNKKEILSESNTKIDQNLFQISPRINSDSIAKNQSDMQSDINLSNNIQANSNICNLPCELSNMESDQKNFQILPRTNSDIIVKNKSLNLLGIQALALSNNVQVSSKMCNLPCESNANVKNLNKISSDYNNLSDLMSGTSNSSNLILKISKVDSAQSVKNNNSNNNVDQAIKTLERQIITNSNAVWSNLNNLPSNVGYPSYVNKNLFALSNNVYQNLNHLNLCICKLAEHLRIDL